MEPSKELAIKLLETLEFTVEEIPETEDERADLMVSDDVDSYVMETKDKSDVQEPDWHTDALKKGEVAHDAQPTTQNNRIDGVFVKARDQMDQTPTKESAFHVIWFQADGRDKQLIWDRAFATFYGTVDLIPVGGKKAKYQPCYYFDYATSYRIPTVDAVILSDGRYLQLLLNEFSPKLDAFRRSKLFSEFGDSLADPSKLEADGEIIAFRADMPQKNDEPILAAILESTGTKYKAVRMVRYAASVMVPNENGKNGE